jgi:hypothetical protein
MPVILIALIVGVVIAAGMAIYYWRNPGARRPITDGKPLIVLGLIFIGLSIVYAVTDGTSWYVWGPVGIVFLAVGLSQNRQHTKLRTETEADTSE